MQKFKILGQTLLGKSKWTEIEELMRENEELMRKLRNTDNSGHYVRQRTNNVRAHAIG